MKILVFVSISLAEAFLHPRSNELISKTAGQSPSVSYRNHSNAACPGRCESGWTYYDETDACYKNFFWANFNDAESICVTVGAHLASIHSYKENSFVADLARTGNTVSGSSQATWIGLVRADYIHSSWTAKWMWTDGTKVDYLAWYKGRPVGGTTPFCVELLSDPPKDTPTSYQKWYDYYCTTVLRSFVCKKMALH